MAMKNELIATGAAPAIDLAVTLLTVITADVAAAPAAGKSLRNSGGKLTLQSVANGTAGAFASTVTIQVSNDNINWLTAGTLTANGTATTAATDGMVIDAPWMYVRGYVATTGVTGTGGTVSVYVGG